MQALFVSTVFSRPLYVGLTNSLARRYQQHVNGDSDANNFNSRFTDDISEINESLTVEQLLRLHSFKGGWRLYTH